MLDHDQDLDAAERWVDGWQSSIEERAARTHLSLGRLGQLTATVRDEDGLVEVTVASSGAATGLHIVDSFAKRFGADDGR